MEIDEDLVPSRREAQLTSDADYEYDRARRAAGVKIDDEWSKGVAPKIDFGPYPL